MYQVKQNDGIMISLVYLVPTKEEAIRLVEGLKQAGRDAWYVKE